MKCRKEGVKVCLFVGDMIKCVENAKMPKKQNKQKPYFLVNLEKSKGHKKINFMFIFYQ